MTTIDLTAERRKRSDDARDWSVEECLRQTLEDLASGKIKADKVYVAMIEDNGREHTMHYRCSGMNALEAIGTLAAHMNLKARGD